MAKRYLVHATSPNGEWELIAKCGSLKNAVGLCNHLEANEVRFNPKNPDKHYLSIEEEIKKCPQ